MSVVVDDRVWKVERGDGGAKLKVENQKSRELSECARASPMREGWSVCLV
jgi:hypothetical protein